MVPSSMTLPWDRTSSSKYLIDGHLVDVAGDDAIDEFAGIAAADAVFKKRRDVDQSRGAADGVVLVLVRHFVDAGGVIARPLLEV